MSLTPDYSAAIPTPRLPKTPSRQGFQTEPQPIFHLSNNKAKLFQFFLTFQHSHIHTAKKDNPLPGINAANASDSEGSPHLTVSSASNSRILPPHRMFLEAKSQLPPQLLLILHVAPGCQLCGLQSLLSKSSLQIFMAPGCQFLNHLSLLC